MPVDGSMSITWKSPMKPPEPTPHMNRPRAMWSSWAIRWARWNGLWFGMQVTPVPSLICFVRWSAAAMKISGEGMFSHSAVKCSPIQASWNPSSSRRSIWRRSWSSVSARNEPGGCIGIMK